MSIFSKPLLVIPLAITALGIIGAAEYSTTSASPTQIEQFSTPFSGPAQDHAATFAMMPMNLNGTALTDIWPQ
ncbi:hypothetical protein ACVXHM_28245 [Pseudomonas aeruginosa]